MISRCYFFLIVYLCSDDAEKIFNQEKRKHTSDIILHEEYRSFLKEWSGIITDLMSPTFSTEEIEFLHRRICQLIALREGLYPDSEALFCVHQLVHLAEFIKDWGPIMGWWALPGERFISAIKRNLYRGGKSIDALIVNYVKFEEEKQSKFCLRINLLITFIICLIYFFILNRINVYFVE